MDDRNGDDNDDNDNGGDKPEYNVQAQCPLSVEGEQEVSLEVCWPARRRYDHQDEDVCRGYHQDHDACLGLSGSFGLSWL